MTAFTGAASHFAIGGIPDLQCLFLCVASALLFFDYSPSLFCISNSVSARSNTRVLFAWFNLR